jgi:hypothetical protein
VERADRGTTSWLLLVAMLVVTTVLVFQYTKQAMLPAAQTKVLWAAELSTIAGVLVLRSGLWRDSTWASEQARLGTLANNFYEPRREALVNGFAVGLGALVGLWWAAATWSVLFFGARRGVVSRGLFDFEIAAAVGAATGGVLGAVIGLAIGEWWERRHRRQRLARAHHA